MQSLLRELKYALRSLLKRRAFSIITILVLALGIGANTAIFSVVDNVLLRPLPFKDPSRLVQIWHVPPAKSFPGMDRFSLSPANFLDWQAQNDALEMAIFARGPHLAGLVHHSDRGSQYLSIRYTERLAEAEAVASVGSRGDSYDNALAETVNGLYKAELVRRHAGAWRSTDEVELATAEWVEFWNTRRLHSACGDIPPAEFEAAYHAREEVSPAA